MLRDSFLLGTTKHLPDRNLNTKTIRQSVIANHLKSGHDLQLDTSVCKAQISGKHREILANGNRTKGRNTKISPVNRA